MNIQDLTRVAAQFRETGEDIPADVNGDGVVDIKDLVLVAAAFGEAAAAPAIATGDIETGSLQAADVQQWLRYAKQANADPAGIAALEWLLVLLSRRDLLVASPVGAVSNRAYRIITVARWPIPRRASVSLCLNRAFTRFSGFSG